MYNDNNFWNLDPPMINIDGDDYDFGEGSDQDYQFAQTEQQIGTTDNSTVDTTQANATQ